MENKVRTNLLTKEQQKVVDFKNGNLLVSASAGSGKTKVLILRAVKMIKEKLCKVENLLICTFTNAAALEMKNRLRSELENQLKQEINQDERFYISNQIEEINLANISTIHSFCLNYIKQYFFKLGIDPNFSLLEENESNYLKKSALEKTLNYFATKSDEQFDTLFEIFNKSRNVNNFYDNILNVSEFLKSKVDFKIWVEQTVEKCYCTDFERNEAVKTLKDNISQTLKYFLNQINKIELSAQMLKSESLQSLILPMKIYFEQILAITSFSKLRKAVNEKPEFKMLRLGKNATGEEVELLQSLQAVKSEYAKTLKNFVSMLCFGTDEQLKNDLNESKIMALKLFEVVSYFENEYQMLKIKNNQLDFNDLEKYMLELLQQPEIVESLKRKFKFVFVDEYQDINEVQEKIISTISNNNLFMVGDVKQSIYLFRRCEPKIFIDKYNLFCKNSTQGTVQNLNKNFRSEKPILEFCNSIFDNIMNEKTSMVNFKKDARFCYDDKKENSFDVDIKFLETNKKENEETSLEKKLYSLQDAVLKKDEDGLIEKEAVVIVDEIKKVLKLDIFDGKTKTTRKIEFKDIAILTGVKKNVAEKISAVLNTFKIPTTLTYKFKLYQTKVVAQILNFLSLISNCQNDFALLAILKSKFCFLTNTQLAKIRLAFPEEKYFYDAVENYCQNINDEIGKKIKQLKEQINLFKQKSAYLSVFELLKEIIIFYDVEEKCCADNESKCNLKMFENMVNQQNKSLTEFLDYVFNFALDQEFEKTTSSENNSVVISTIHSSKGLEYPVVILAGANKEFNKISLRNEVLLSKDFGLGVKFYDVKNRIEKNTLVRTALAKNIEQNEISEKIRLLYVALTRAKNKLIVIGSGKLNNFESFEDNFQILKSKSYMEMMLCALKKDELETLKKNKKLVLNLPNNAKTNFEIIESQIIDGQGEENKETPLPLKNDFEKLLEKFWNFKYDNALGNETALKNTVTAMAMFEEEKNNYKTKNFDALFGDNIKEESDYLSLGNAYHKIMETCVKQNIYNIEKIKEVIENFAQGDILFQKFYLEVDVNRIEKALKFVKNCTNKNSKVFCEQKFMMFIECDEIANNSNKNKILVQGVIDLIIENENEIIIVDYKTTKFHNDIDFIKKYQKQLEIYELAIKKQFVNTKKQIKKIIYSFYKDNAIII